MAAVLVASVLAFGLVGCAQSTGGHQTVAEVPSAPERIHPWEWWRDLATIASVPEGDRVVMRSSHCQSGCRFDRHSKGESRLIRVRDDGEGVIFSTEGAGAVTRIWMVMGDGISDPLDPNIRLRVRLDGRRRPVVDLPLPELFSGGVVPFSPPLVADRTETGGGHVSYVPIPFRKGCEITLVGANDAKIWFQITARLVEDGSAIRSFSGEEPLEGFSSMLRRAGSDPWPGGDGLTVSGSAYLSPGDSHVMATLEGPDLVNGLIIRAARKNWRRLGLRFTFDDGEPQVVPLMDFYGVPNLMGDLTRSLFFGLNDDADLYCYFPMPFFSSAKIELMRRPLERPFRIKVEYALRTAGESPPLDSGTFGVQVRLHEESAPGPNIDVLGLDGRGSLVGLVADLEPLDDGSWKFLEGDERIFIDGEEDPSWHGTGVEDLFNGGFYFRDPTGVPAPFTTALAGAPFLVHASPRAVMYRLLLGDAIVFSDGIRAEMEMGPTGDLNVRARTVWFYYLAPDTQVVEPS